MDNMTAEELVEGTLSAVGYALGVVVDRAWKISPRVATHALAETTADAMLRLITEHPSDRAALIEKLDSIRALVTQMGRVASDGDGAQRH